MQPTHPRPARLAELLGIDPQVAADLEAVTPADILDGARRYLTRYGWTQVELYERSGRPFPPACAYGAIRMAVTGTADSRVYHHDQAAQVRQAMKVLAGYLEILGITCLPYDPDPARVELIVTDWNDEPDRTVTEVTAAMAAAAHTWRRTHQPAQGR